MANDFLRLQMSRWDACAVENLADDAAGAFALSFSNKAFAGHSVSEDGYCQLLHVVRRDEVTVVDDSLSLGGSIKSQRSSRTDPECLFRVFARGRYDGQ